MNFRCFGDYTSAAVMPGGNPQGELSALNRMTLNEIVPNMGTVLLATAAESPMPSSGHFFYTN